MKNEVTKKHRAIAMGIYVESLHTKFAQALADLEQATAERCWDEGYAYGNDYGWDGIEYAGNPYRKTPDSSGRL